MKTLEYAQKKWENKMKGKGTVWKEHTSASVNTYAENMAKFLGLPSISQDKINAYKSGVDIVSAEDFEKAIEGKGRKYAERFLEAFKP